jgi:hypothetical protein
LKTIKQVEITPVFVEFIPDVLEEGKVYISEEYQCSVHNCLCGCGERTVLPLINGGWQLIKHDDGKVSFTPSVGNFQMPCKSHYIITKNKANFL